MRRGPTGDTIISTGSGERVGSFVPYGLPPSPPIEWTGQRHRLLERATLALGRLDAIATMLPDPHLFIYSYVRREAVLSSQIEGTQSSLSDLLLFELEGAPGVPLHDVVEVSNYVAALDHGLTRLREGFPLSNRLIRELHRRLLARGRGAGKQPGEFRRSQNWIGGTRPGNAAFVPPPPSAVEQCMASLERFINAEDGAPPALVRAALAHVQFETIHPFLDGNGRVGRLLIALMLHADGVLREPLLYLSLFLKQHRSEYYRLLGVVRTDGDWEAWLDFFLEGVEVTAAGAVETADRLRSLIAADRERIRLTSSTRAPAERAFGALCERPLITIGEAARRAGVSFPTASKGIHRLIDLGIVREITGRRRGRVFAYQGYMELLSEGAEPL
jgi:Fic family protein